jgi:diaminopimelate epimerase
MTNIKCQSLGNKFILLDWHKKSHREIEKIITDASWSEQAIKLCDNTDGIIIVGPGKTPVMHMFNSDGSNGQMCLNGARCVAQYLHINHNFPEIFSIEMSGKIIENIINKNKNNFLITQHINRGKILGKKSICVDKKIITGYVADMGNPHFIVFEKKQTENWLRQNGHLLEQHPKFPNKTNVEFVWQANPSLYRVIVYERGCGLTQACSSGATAITQLLYEQNKILLDEKIEISMPGGTIKTWITQNKKIALQTTCSY